MAATTTLPVLFGTGIHASRPSASAVGAGGLYACSTHSLIYQTDGVSTWSTWATLGSGSGLATDTLWDTAGDLVVGTGANTAAKLVIGANGYVLTSNGTTAAWAASAGGGGGSALAFVYLATIAR